MQYKYNNKYTVQSMCLCNINTIINIKYNQCECVNDDVDDMNNVTWIVIESKVSDIAQVPQ